MNQPFVIARFRRLAQRVHRPLGEVVKNDLGPASDPVVGRLVHLHNPCHIVGLDVPDERVGTLVTAAEKQAHRDRVVAGEEPRRGGTSDAWDHGYYAVPREGGIEEVADELDCTVSTASALLRRAERELVADLFERP